MRHAKPTCCSRSASASTTGPRDSWIPGYSFTIPPTRLIHVDIDPEEIGRNYPVALGLMADVRTFLRQVHAEARSARQPLQEVGCAQEMAGADRRLPQGVGQVRRARLLR
ncbi:hypothetical protein ACVOMS_34150 [Bradyrhizobium guangxiense]